MSLNMESIGVVGVRLCCSVTIPLRDGARLGATVYLSDSRQGGAPCILTMTPYIADTHHKQGVFFASHGMPYVVVDGRGRGSSDGTFRPYIREAEDGYDVVEWVATQPFCNGKVAMWGGSYSGYCQWVTAKNRPPHLTAIAPVASPYIGVDVPMRNNIFYPFIMQWILFTSGRASQVKLFTDDEFWAAKYRQWHLSGLPFCELDRWLGQPSGIFQEWIAHPEPDEYWDAHNPTAQEYGGIDIPVLTITGSYDDDQPGALEHYRRHLAHASASARAQHHLIIGPWDHGGTRIPRREIGGVSLGPDSELDLLRLHLDWYRWRMQSGQKPNFLKKPVACYVMGAEKWRYAETLEALTARRTDLFLGSDGGANDVFRAGKLSVEPGRWAPDSYTYDPDVTDAPEVDAEAQSHGGSLVDQTVTFALCGKQFVYHSAPFEEDTEISGFFELQVWLSIDCPDTDMYVSVHEIDLHGNSIRLSTDAMRARYRDGLRKPKLIETIEPLLYTFDRFTFVARLISRRHRLRLTIAPMGRIVEALFVQRNYNGGGIVSQECLRDSRPVTVRLFHDFQHPSRLLVPLGHAHGV